MRIVVALGGNALLRRGDHLDASIQVERVKAAARPLAPLAHDHDLLICHGNGPQVGMLALESQSDPALSAPCTLDDLVAQTQGMIGYWLVQSLYNTGVLKPVLTAARAKSLLASIRPREEVAKMRKTILVEMLGGLVIFDKKIKAITAGIKTIVTATTTTVTEIHGVGTVTAALILGEVLDVARFVDEGHFASYNGTAPIEWGSGGGTGPFILNRGGNRRLNNAMHMIALSQIRTDTPGRDYYRHKLAAGKTKKEALRCLKRKVSAAVNPTPTVDTSIKPQPGPRPKATSNTAIAS